MHELPPLLIVHPRMLFSDALYYRSASKSALENAGRIKSRGGARMAAQCGLKWFAACSVHGAFAGALLTVAQLAGAQQPSYPVKTIRLIASQSAGGGVDTVARLVASRLSEAVGQSVIVDNRAGANGSLAAEMTTKSPPDGYTLMLGAAGNLGVNAFFIKQMNYDPFQDLAPVTLAVSSSNVLVIHPSVPVKSVRELLALAKARPGALAYGSSGVGGAGHLAGALFQSMTKINLLHVPYKGGAPAMVDLVAGQVQLSFASTPTAVPNISSGRLRVLAVTTARRSKILPDLPTVAEAGVPGYEAHSWYGFVVPAKTPQGIVVRLNKEIVEILSRPDSGEALLRVGLETWTSTPEAFGAYIKSEYDKWGRIIREVGITAN
jgi:tripartite-type tricarboxylate transporter receptor subunit TctC